MEKKISKEKLDAVMELTRSYWDGGAPVAAFDGIRALCEEIMDGAFIPALSLKSFISEAVKPNGIGGEADNQTIYNALQLFGWDIE
jgi:hypothetical protein